MVPAEGGTACLRWWKLDLNRWPHSTLPGDRLAARALWSGVHGVCILAVSDKLDVVGVESVQNLTDLLSGNFLKGFAEQPRKAAGTYLQQ